MTALVGTCEHGQGHLSRRDVGVCVAVAVLIVFAHREALSAMVGLWNVSPMYSYGFTVPFISAFLVWTRRSALARLRPEPSWLGGGALILMSIAMVAAARSGGIQLLDQLAFLVSLTAAVLLLLGKAYARVAWAALAYLLLMIPIWDGFTEALHAPFQLRSAAIGVRVLQMVGIPAFREGTLIVLPGLKMEVARACSGVNYLIAVLALGLPLAYLYLHGIWRRTLLLVAALVVAALSNGLRVALIGILAHLEIGSPLHGPLHVLHGLFVAGVGYLVLFAGLHLLTKQPTAADENAAASDRETNDRRSRPAGILGHGGVSLRTTTVLALILIGVGFNAFWRGSRAVHLQQDLRSMPTVLGEWTSERDLAFSDSVSSSWQSADSELKRRYRRKDGAIVDLYIAYFASQRQDKEIFNSQAAGLQRMASRVRLAGVAGDGLEVNYSAGAGDAPARMFWYQLDRGPEADPYVVKARTMWSAISSGRSSGAVIVLASRRQGRSAGRELEEFAPLVARALAARLPRNTPPAGT